MATAKKLPSGKYRCLIYIGMQDGKRKYKSFTADSKKKAEYAADAYLLRQKRVREHLCVRDAVTLYIDTKEPVLSPSTVRSYRNALPHFDGIGDALVEDLTTAKVQSWISGLSRNMAPKTVRNTYSLLSAAVKMYAPDIALHPRLPQREKPVIQMPTDADVKAMLDFFRGTQMEACIMLAAFGTLRRSEICGLVWDDVTGNTIHVRRSIVRAEKGYSVKAPKTDRSDRFITLSPQVISRLRELCPGSPLVTIQPEVISNTFAKAVRKLKLRHITFHGLRHYSAAVMHLIGVPEQYAMLRGGWENKATLSQIYEGALPDKTDTFTEAINGYFDRLL